MYMMTLAETETEIFAPLTASTSFEFIEGVFRAYMWSPFVVVAGVHLFSSVDLISSIPRVLHTSYFFQTYTVVH